MSVKKQTFTRSGRCASSVTPQTETMPENVQTDVVEEKTAPNLLSKLQRYRVVRPEQNVQSGVVNEEKDSAPGPAQDGEPVESKLEDFRMFLPAQNNVKEGKEVPFSAPSPEKNARKLVEDLPSVVPAVVHPAQSDVQEETFEAPKPEQESSSVHPTGSSSSTMSLTPSSLDVLITEFGENPEDKIEEQNKRRTPSDGPPTVQEIFDARSSTSSIQSGRELLRKHTPSDGGPWSSPDITNVTADDSCTTLDTSRASPVVSSYTALAAGNVPAIVTTSPSVHTTRSADEDGDLGADSRPELCHTAGRMLMSDEENSFKAVYSR